MDPSVGKITNKIIVIGAGASGVAAATKLVSNGFKDVTILEGEDRFGGRIKTIPFGKNVLDIGAQWCHGEKNNVVFELAKDADLLVTSGEYNFEFVRSNGEKIPSEISEKLSKIAWDIYGGDDYVELQKTYHGSRGNFFAEK